MGHPLDPIGCLFDTLTDASIVRDETTNTSQGIRLKMDVYYLCDYHFVQDWIYFRIYISIQFVTSVLFFPEMYEQPSENDADAPPPKYQHVVIPGNRDRNESYLTLALEAALIGVL